MSKTAIIILMLIVFVSYLLPGLFFNIPDVNRSDLIHA